MLGGSHSGCLLLQGLLNYAQLVRPHCINLLTRFVLEAYVVSNPRNRRCAGQPLVLSAPFSEGTRLLLGIPPVKEEGPKK